MQLQLNNKDLHLSSMFKHIEKLKCKQLSNLDSNKRKENYLHKVCVSFQKMGEDLDFEPDEMDPNAGRFVRYQFTPQFLKLKTVGAT